MSNTKLNGVNKPHGHKVSYVMPEIRQQVHIYLKQQEKSKHGIIFSSNGFPFFENMRNRSEEAFLNASGLFREVSSDSYNRGSSWRFWNPFDKGKIWTAVLNWITKEHRLPAPTSYKMLFAFVSGDVIGGDRYRDNGGAFGFLHAHFRRDLYALVLKKVGERIGTRSSRLNFIHWRTI